MRKLLTLFLALCLIPMLGNAQSYVDEDFSTATGTTPPTGWVNTTVVGVDTVDNWQFANPGGRTLNAPISDPAAIFDSDNLSNNGTAEDVTLETPAFDATGVNIVTLEFDHYFQAGFGGAYDVEVFDGTAWVSVLSGAAASTANPQHEIIDVSTQLAGVANAQVRFHWTGNYSWYWILDNVEVYAPIQYPDDVATLNVSSSAVNGSCNTSTETVTIEVVNLGTNAASNIGASFAVDGGAPVTPEIIAGPVNPGDTIMYTFTATADLSVAGPHTIEAGATVLGDGDTSNDTADVSILTGGSIAAPFVEDFENAGALPTGWSTDGSSAFDWTVDENGTGSSGTGPDDDHSDPGTYYIYTEASSGSLGNIDELFSPCIDLSALTAPRLSYWYHMYGATMGNLYVDVVAGGVRTRIDSITGQQQTANADPFLERLVNINAYAGQTIQLIFVGQRGSSFTGDMALDDISVFEATGTDVVAANVGLSTPIDCSNLNAAGVAITVSNFGATSVTGVSVSISVDGAAPTVESIAGTLNSGDDTTYVFTATADLSVAGPHTIDVTATTTGDANLGNDSTSFSITSPGILVAPFIEDFEEAGNFPAGWTVGINDLPWQMDENGTGSGGTGPTEDHTDPGSYYAYTEASGPATGAVGELISPCIDLSSITAPQLRYWYHMHGADMGNLYVDVVSGGMTTRIDSLIGEQHPVQTDPWLERVLDLSAFMGQTVQLVFVGVRDDGFTSDIALDDIEIFQPPPFDLAAASLDVGSSLCNPTAAEMVTISFDNVGFDTLQSGMAQFSVDGGAYTALETIPGPIAPGSSTSFTFAATADLSATGPHDIAVVVRGTPDLDASNDSLTGTVISVPLVTPAFPYTENFDMGANGWTSGGVNSTWVLTTPNKSVINSAYSAPNSWVNGDTTGSYVNDEASWVASPCFDMTNAPANTSVSMRIWYETETDWDGTVLQSSNDGGVTWTNVGAVGAPNNWYNDSDVDGMPGGQLEGWSGDAGDGTNGWVIAHHPLDSMTIGQAAVRFRIAFGSDGAVISDGFAFDNFTLSSAPQLSFPDSLLVCGSEMLDAGNPGATYDWSTGDSTQMLAIANMSGMNIIDSTITITVTDSLGLSATSDIVLTIPASTPSGMAMVMDTIACNGDSTGSIMVSAMGGTAPYSYSWNTADSTDMAMGLPAGSYNVTVADSFGCTFDAMATITEPTAISVALDSLINVDCPDDSTGAINITVSGGAGGYTYSWSNGSTSQNLSMLAVGGYTGVITDADGCVLTSPVLTVAANDTFPVAAFDYVPGDVNYDISFTSMSTDADSLLWDFGDGNTSTEASPSYTFAANDTFIVSLTATNDCGTSTKTDTIIVTNVGIEDDLLSRAVQVYPNPNSGNFDVEFAGINLDKVALSVSNAAGQTIYTRNIGQVRGNYTHAVSLPSTLAGGLYILEVRTPEAVMHKRLIIE